MSRTYRKIPHFVSKRDLADDFHTRSFYHGRGRLRNAATEKDFVKIAIARYRSDNMGRDGLSDTFRMTTNGKPLGYTEWSRSDGWAKRFANKRRRNADKAVVAEAVDELIEEYSAALEEMAEMTALYEQDYHDYFEDYLRDDDPHDYHRSVLDFEDDPYEPYDDRWQFEDPMWDDPMW